MYNSSKLIDGYALNSSSDNSFLTDWIDVRNYSYFIFTVVFTGGNPEGDLTLEISNDRQFTGGNSVKPLLSVNAENSNGAIKSISDATPNIYFYWGQITESVNGDGVYPLEQKINPFGWARVKYVATSNVNTQLDIFLTIKT